MEKIGIRVPFAFSEAEHIETIITGGMEYEIYSLPGTNRKLVAASHEDVGLVTWYDSYNDLGGLIDELMIDNQEEYDLEEEDK